MPGPCDTGRYALSATDLSRMSRQLGFEHLTRRLARHPGGLAARRFARMLARAAAEAGHAPHAAGQCRRAGQLGGQSVMLLTVADGPRHMIRSARWHPSPLSSRPPPSRRSARDGGAGVESEALFDAVIG